MKHRWLGIVGTVLPTLLVAQTGAQIRCLLALVSLFGLGQGELRAEEASFVIPRVARAPQIEDFADMEVAEAPGMQRIEGLVQRVPTDGGPISQRTIVLLGYDETRIYAVFLCFDDQARGIRAHLAARDRFPDDDDSVALHVDTFYDHKHAYGFQVNSLGVQIDALWTEGRGWDYSYDTQWSTEARITPRGYVVLMAIPFKSVRFDNAARQTWGFFVNRGIPRNGENAYWPAYSLRLAGRLNQEARLDGIEGVSPGHNLQWIPYVTHRSLGGTSPFSDGEAKAGIDAKAVLLRSLVVDGTVHPDFSQVESDEPQVTVTQRFEPLFPEKRPFFQENASYFDTPTPLFFSRRVSAPSSGVRLTGRLGSTTVGGLFLDDDGLPGSDVRRLDSHARVQVLRLNRDVGRESSLGGFYSRRSQGRHANQVAALDTRLKLSSHWVTSLQAAHSETSGAGADGHSTVGSALTATVQRAGRALNYDAQYLSRSPGFNSDVGFIQRTDIRSLDQTLSVRSHPSQGALVAWGPELVMTQTWDYRAHPLDSLVTPRFVLEGTHRTSAAVFAELGHIRLRKAEVPSGRCDCTFPSNSVGATVQSDRFSRLTLSATATVGDAVNLFPRAEAIAGRVRSTDLSLKASARLLRGLILDSTYLHSSLREPATRRPVLSDDIVRLNLQFQLTRALAMRVIFQRESLAPVRERTSAEAKRVANWDVLLTYLAAPGTALFVGYNSGLSDLPSGQVGRGATHGRALFLKLSYLFRT